MPDARPGANDRAVVELGRFLTLAQDPAAWGESGWMPMFSGFIYSIWHQQLGDPEGFTAFCQAHAGAEIVHIERRGFGPVDWVAAYEAAYGPLPLLWFVDAAGAVDKVAWDAYLDTGIVVTGWDCGPKIAEEDEELEPFDPAPLRPTIEPLPRPQQKPEPGYGSGSAR